MNPHAFVLGDPDVLMKDVWLKVPTTVAETTIGAEELTTPAGALSGGEEIDLGDEVTPEPDAADGPDRDLLETRNAELQARLEATRTELESANAKVETLEGQVSTLRRQLAGSEARTPVWRATVTRVVDVTRRNSITVTALGVLILLVLLLVFVGNRSKGQALEQEEPEEPEREATRTETGRPMPEAAGRDIEAVYEEYAPATKLNLARAFIDMGRAEQAREVLTEVLAEGNEDERREADELLGQMG